MSAGNEREFQNMHGRHQLLCGEYLLQTWFLLVNGLWLSISQQLGLGSPIELLGCATIRELAPSPLRIFKREYFFLREYDRRAGLEPLSVGEHMAIPSTRLVALIHPKFISQLISHLNHREMSRLKYHIQYTLIDGQNNPRMCEVAEEADRSLDVTLSELVGVCNRNAARLYNLSCNLPFLMEKNPLLHPIPANAQLMHLV